MRAARLLRILLMLQNRGRMTSGALAEELEVARRTILRDVDAMTEAGLPVVVYQGSRGGIELGFNYRTRLTGLAMDEAEALAVLFNQPAPELDALGMRASADRARAKLIESFPDTVRKTIALSSDRFRFDAIPNPGPDPRVAAIAAAIRGQRVSGSMPGQPYRGPYIRLRWFTARGAGRSWTRNCQMHRCRFKPVETSTSPQKSLIGERTTVLPNGAVRRFIVQYAPWPAAAGPRRSLLQPPATHAASRQALV